VRAANPDPPRQRVPRSRGAVGRREPGGRVQDSDEAVGATRSRGDGAGCSAGDWLRQVSAVVLAVVSWHCVAALAGPIEVKARREGEAVLVEASAQVHADPQVAWEVLTAYDRYAEFVPDLKSSRVLARAGDTTIVEQKGEARFLVFHFPLEVVLAVTEQPPHSVSARAISGNFREMTGVYQLTADGDSLRLTYTGRLVPAFRLLPLIGVPALRAAVERQFTALVREIGRRAAIDGSPAEAR